MRDMPRQLRHFLIALQFMTIFRVRKNLEETPEELAASVGYYPLVGLVLGLIMAGLGVVFAAIWPPAVSGLLLALALALATQGLHLDGLADAADGLFSHRPRERKLEIMKDSAVGVFGAVALVFVIGLKAVLLAALVARPGFWPILILWPVWGRVAVSLTTCLSVYARPSGGLARPFIDMAGTRELGLASGSAAILCLIVWGLPGLIVALVVALAALAALGIWNRRLGGVTGDILGTTAELGEALGLLLAAAWI